MHATDLEALPAHDVPHLHCLIEAAAHLRSSMEIFSAHQQMTTYIAAYTARMLCIFHLHMVDDGVVE